MCQVLAMISHREHFMIAPTRKPAQKLPRKMRRANVARAS